MKQISKRLIRWLAEPASYVPQGPMETRVDELPGFDGVRLLTSATVRHEGSMDMSAAAASITAPSDLLPCLTLKVTNNVLYVQCMTDVGLIDPSLVSITVRGPALNYVWIARFARMQAWGLCHKKMQAVVEGGACLEAHGQVMEFDATVDGYAKLNAFDLRAEVLRVSAHDSVFEGFASSSVEIKAKGSSRVMVRGHPPVVRRSLSGNSSLELA